jgi:ribosomal protein S14
MLKSISVQQQRQRNWKAIEFKKRVFQLIFQASPSFKVVEWLRKYQAALYFKRSAFKNRKICVLTGRYRAVNRKTQLSRMGCRSFINTGFWPGFRKLSW